MGTRRKGRGRTGLCGTVPVEGLTMGMLKSQGCGLQWVCGPRTFSWVVSWLVQLASDWLSSVLEATVSSSGTTHTFGQVHSYPSGPVRYGH